MRLSVIGMILRTRSSVRAFMTPSCTKYLKLGNPTATISTTISTSTGDDLPKLCINCKHYLPCEVHPSYGKCAKFVQYENTNYYVTGEGERIIYDYCSVARFSTYMCGKNGTKFEEKSV